MMKAVALFLKGIAMGAADVVPGVSGGTIAFITGIYQELLDSIQRINTHALRTLWQQGPKAAWQAINGTFLFTLGSGVLFALFSLARVLHYLLLHHAEFLWSFFFGLILASCWHIVRTIPHWHGPQLLAICIGTILAASISLLAPTSIEVTPWVIFFAGSIAICAMILPGISGSFILLLMGLYEPILGAVKQFDVGVLAIFASGALLGLMSFSRVLSWLLTHYRATMLALLTGFMAGSLAKVWPWKETVQYRMNSSGDAVPWLQINQWPSLHDGGALLLSLLLMLGGALAVILLERWAVSDEDVKNDC